MPEIKAFNGVRYNPSKIRDFKKVLAPPYDVISKKEQEALYENHPNNVIRLELGKDQAGDSQNSNKYTRARDFLVKWSSDGVLIQDKQPSIYVYRQTYPEKNKKKVRLGFIAAMKIDEKAVLKHENTLAAPKADRLNLLKETRTNLSPIWGLYEDKSKGVFRRLSSSTKQKPVVDVTVDGVRHELFREADPKAVAEIQGGMKAKPMFIADGHHRFETACNYKKLSGAGFVMTYFSDCTNNPFTIYPTHRLVSFDTKKTDALAELAKRGSIKKVSGLSSVLSALEKHRGQIKGGGYDFGVLFQNQYYLFALDKKLASKIDKKSPVDTLDVSVLHRFLIEPIFGIKKIEKSQEIDFTRDPKAAVEMVKEGKFNIAFFLRPTSLPEMLEASKKGLKMPQKSTYFYPKLLSGMVFHKVENSL